MPRTFRFALLLLLAGLLPLVFPPAAVAGPSVWTSDVFSRAVGPARGLPGSGAGQNDRAAGDRRGVPPLGAYSIRYRSQRGRQDEFYYLWDLNLVNFQDSLPRPRFDPASFAAFLAEGEFRYAFVQENRRTFALAPGSVFYRGTASLVDGPSPVPEPMSLLLVGSGVCGIGVRAWRRKRRVNR